MAQDLQIDLSGDVSVSITLNSLANNTNVLSTVIDLGAIAPLFLAFEAVLDGNSASNTGVVFWYASWSNDNVSYSDANNDEPFAVSLMNGTTSFAHIFPLEVKARYLKIRARNESGDSLASTGNTLAYTEGAVDQA